MESVAKQLEKIAASLDGDAPLASKILLELARIEQFKAIASGQNNTIYFAKDGNLGSGYLTDVAGSLKNNIDKRV